MATAKGKITAARIVPGETRVMVRVLEGGKFVESVTKVKDATPAMVQQMTRHPAGTKVELPCWDGVGSVIHYARRSFFSMVVATDDGRELTRAMVTPSQTFWLAPDST